MGMFSIVYNEKIRKEDNILDNQILYSGSYKDTGFLAGSTFIFLFLQKMNLALKHN